MFFFFFFSFFFFPFPSLTLTLGAVRGATFWLAEGSAPSSEWSEEDARVLSSGSARGRMRAGGNRRQPSPDTLCCCCDDDEDEDDAVLKLFLFFLLFFFKALFWTEGAVVARLIWLQVKCDVLAACCEISLTTTTTSSTTTITTITDAPSQEWWALSWPDRGVSISTASCPRGDARGMTARGRAREVAAETSCLPPWCSSPTSCQGCCGKPTTAHMWGGWRGSGRSRGFSGSRRRSRRPKCSNCWGRWGGGDVTGGIPERNFYFETLLLKRDLMRLWVGFCWWARGQKKVCYDYSFFKKTLQFIYRFLYLVRIYKFLC